MVTGDMTLVAQWNPITYTITYYGNGGTWDNNGTASDSYTQMINAVSDKKQTFDANKFVRKGYEFAGWNTKATGGKNNYSDGKTISSPRDMTLYAQWKAVDYKVTYGDEVVTTVPYETEITIDPNGGEVNASDKAYKHTVTENTPLPTPTKTGATFTGWQVEGTTITAQWNAQTFTLTYDAGEGATVKLGSDKKQVVSQSGIKYGDDITVPTPVKAGATFNGWKYKSTGMTADAFAAGKTIEYTWLNNIELEASWTENTYKVNVQVGDKTQLHADNLKYGDKVPQVTAGDDILGVPAGQTIVGWYTDEDFTKEWNFKKDTISDNMTLYAQWQASKVAVTYNRYVEGADYQETTVDFTYGDKVYINPNGGTAYDKTERYLYEITKAITLKDATRDGYVFNGWLYDADSRTLTAQWKNQEYKVTFNANGGNFSDKTTEQVVTTTGKKEVKFPGKDSLKHNQGDKYVLLGWSEAANGPLQYKLSETSSLTNVDRDVTLYAIWAEVLDFGDVASGDTKTETMALNSSITDTKGAEHFNLKATIVVKPSLDLGTYTDLITVTTASGTHYIQATVNVTMGEVTVGIAGKKNTYVVGDELTVAVQAAPNQKLSLAVDGNTEGALVETKALTEDKNNKGNYYATYKVDKITADALALKLTVKSAAGELATADDTIQLRTVLNVTVKNSDKDDTSLKSVTLINKEDTSKTQAITSYDATSGKYTTLIDKASGWDYVAIETTDGRTVNLDTTTTGQTLGDALLGTKGEINMAYTFQGYTVTGQLYVNGEKVDYPTFSVNGDYGDKLDLSELTKLAEERVKDLCPKAIQEKYATKVTMTDGSDVSVKTFGDTDIVWENNTLNVNVNVTVGYNVTFDNTHGKAANMPEAQFILHNRGVSKPADPTKAGYVFAGWTTDEAGKNAYDFSRGVTDSMVLYAQWKKADYTVTFNNNYGDNYGADTAWAPQTVSHGDKVTAPAKTPEREGYTFEGWSTTPDRSTGFWDLNKDTVTESITLYAQWKQNEYTVSYNTNPPAGMSVTNPEGTFSAKTVKHGEAIAAPADPVINGYTFKGWTVNGQAVTFPMTITRDTELVAQWAKVHTVTFYTLVENSIAKDYYTVEVADGATIPAQATPVRDGYLFTGWYTDEACTTPWIDTNTVTADVQLYAGWDKIDVTGGDGLIFDVTSTSASAMIRLKYSDGTMAPASGITDLQLIAKDVNGNDLFATPVIMKEIKPGSPQWQEDWDPSYAYYVADYSSQPLTVKATLQVQSDDYNFNYGAN